MHIEPGYYAFRVTGTNPEGELQIFTSWSKEAADYSQLRENQASYLQYLTERGNTNLKITHTVSCEPPKAEQVDWYID